MEQPRKSFSEMTAEEKKEAFRRWCEKQKSTAIVRSGYDCPTCEGKGYIDCGDCDGTGKVDFKP